MFLVILQLFDGVGLSEDAAGDLLVVALGFYSIFLHWILARHGLHLRAWRALLLVIVVNAGTVLLVMGPRWIDMLVNW